MSRIGPTLVQLRKGRRTAPTPFVTAADPGLESAMLAMYALVRSDTVLQTVSVLEGIEP